MRSEVWAFRGVKAPGERADGALIVL